MPIISAWSNQMTKKLMSYKPGMVIGISSLLRLFILLAISFGRVCMAEDESLIPKDPSDRVGPGMKELFEREE